MARYLVDTNVLLRGAVRTAARNPAATHAIAILLAQGDELLLAPQVLTEFWSVATRPVDVNGFGWSVDVVRTEIDKLLDQFPLMPETPAVFDEWLHLVTKHRVIGKQVYDARLAAFVRTHQIARLLTFNTSDFGSYGITVVSPEDVAANRA